MKGKSSLFFFCFLFLTRPQLPFDWKGIRLAWGSFFPLILDHLSHPGLILAQVLFLFGLVDQGFDAFCHGHQNNSTQYYGTQHKCTHQPSPPYFVHTYCAHTHMGCSPRDFSTVWALHGLLNNMSVLYIAIISRGSRNIFWSFCTESFWAKYG